MYSKLLKMTEFYDEIRQEYEKEKENLIKNENGEYDHGT